MNATPPAGWYQDPENPGQQRYWDGMAWTDHRAPAPGQMPPQQPHPYSGRPTTATPMMGPGGPNVQLGKPKKPWWQRWWAIAAAVFIVLMIVGSIGGGSDPAQTNTASDDSSSAATESVAPAADDESTTPQASDSAAPAKKPSKVPAKTKPAGLNADPGHANKVTPGSSFVLGDFRIRRGWKISKIGYGFGYELKGLEVENLTSEEHMFSVDIKLRKGAHRVVADMTCLADSAKPGDIVEVDCFPDGSGKPYDSVTIENSF